MKCGTTIRSLVLPLFALALSWSAAEWAQAQVTQYNRPGAPTTYRRLLNQPTVSPYLELLSPDSAVGLPTYYTRVRPQIEARQLERQAAQQLNSLQSQVRSLDRAGSPSGGLIQTGHPTRFMNYTHYYPSLQR